MQRLNILILKKVSIIIMILIILNLVSLLFIYSVKLLVNTQMPCIQVQGKVKEK